MQEVSFRRAVQASLLGLALAVTQGAYAASIDEVPSGTMLSKDNWEIGKGLMPDEILEFYKKGEYANPIIKLEAVNKSVVDPNLKAASEKNRGKFDIDEHGTVVAKEDGKRPAIITGQPFPDIDPVATASVLVAMLAQVSGHRYGIERYGTTGPEIRRVMARLLFTGITGRKPPA